MDYIYVEINKLKHIVKWDQKRALCGRRVLPVDVWKVPSGYTYKVCATCCLKK